MQQVANLITIDDPISAGELALRLRANHKRNQSVRKGSSDVSRNDKKMRNMSARLPLIDRPTRRYDEERETTDSNIINFVKASRRQMKGAIQQQQPQARRFLDDNLGTIPHDPSSKSGLALKDQLAEMMPSFSNNQMMNRVRPSVHSVTNSVNRKLKLSLAKMDEESEMSQSRTGRKKPLQVDNLTAMLSPQGGLSKNISKVSLGMDSYHAGVGQSMSAYTSNRNSPTGQSSMTMQVFGRELKHITKYLDVREMQIRQELENTQRLNPRLEQNKNLQDLFHQIMSQVRSKLPNQSSIALSELVKRIMDGLGECFELQDVTYNKKVDARDKKIQQLNTELDEIKESYAEFKRESTVDAFFKKHTDIVDRTGRQPKDYMKDLNKVVEDYLGQTNPLDDSKIADQRQLAKEAEPSGVESMLIQLQQISRNIEVPAVPENPLIQLDAEKDAVMKDFRRALKSEANNIRNVVEHKVKDSLGLVKPTREIEVQTLTYNRLKDDIMMRGRMEIERTITAQTEEKFAIKLKRWQGEIKSGEEKYALMRQKLSEMQQKLAKKDAETYVDVIREKIIAFFNMKLGKGSATILKEFNTKIMDITSSDVSVNRMLRSISSFQESQSEITRKSLANQFDSVIKSAESRRSEQSMVKVIDAGGSVERGLKSQDSYVSINQADVVAEVNAGAEDESPTPLDKQQRRKLNTATKKVAVLDETEGVALEEVKSKEGTAIKAPPKTAVDSTQQQDDAAPETGVGKTNAELSGTASPDKQSAAGETDRQTPFNKSGLKSPSPQQSPKNSVKGKKNSNAGSKLQKQEGSDATTPVPIADVPEVVDDRKDLLKKISASKKVRDALPDFQSDDSLRQAVKKVEKTVEQLIGLQSAADVVSKVVQLNADSEALSSEASTLLLAVLEMGLNDLPIIKATSESAKKSQEMHELLEQVYKFYKGAMTKKKNKKSLPPRADFLEHVTSMDKINEMVPDLPSKDEIDYISQVEMQCTNLEKKLTSLIDRKFVKPNGPATAVSNNHQAPPNAETKPEPNQIGDAIASITLVRSQIQDSHSVIINAENSSPSEQKLLKKVNRLMTHMDEAVEWLEQKKVDANVLMVASDTDDQRGPSQLQQNNDSQQQNTTLLNFQDREKSLRKKVGKHDSVTEWDGAHPPVTPPPLSDQQTVEMQEEVSKFGERKLTEPSVQHKIIQMQQKAHSYLAANDIEIVEEDTKRENTTSRVSSNLRRDSNTGSEAGNVMSSKTQLGLIGEEDTDGADQDESKKGLADRRSSRIEVFRKTPNKMVGMDNEHQNIIQISDTDSTPMGTLPKPEGQQPMSGGQTPAQLDRKQFADLDLEQAEMTYTFAHGTEQNKEDKTEESPSGQRRVIGQPINIKGQQTAEGNNTLPMRQSQETDYLQTASHFGNDTFRADLNKINVGISASGPNPNETQNFLNNLKEQVAINQRQDGTTPKSGQYPKHSVKEVASRSPDASTPAPLNLNEDLEEAEAKNFIEGSQASSIADQDLSLLDSPLRPAHYDRAQRSGHKGVPNNQYKSQANSLADMREIKMPSALKISQKPVHQLIKVDDIMAMDRLGRDLNEYSQLSSKLQTRKPLNTVLMLTQSTQTENRALIKELLTLINETIMKQLEHQSVKMTPEEFQEQVNQLKAAIPAVYDHVKGSSDTFFIEKMLGPQFTTAHLDESAGSKLGHSVSNKDLQHIVPTTTHTQQTQFTTRPQNTGITHSTGIANVVVGKKNLSPSVSMHTLQRDASTQRILDQVALSQSPSQEHLEQQLIAEQPQHMKPKNQPYLSLGDFSRYGSHTLEISQEVRTRVNLRQVGAAGGGFMGRAVRIKPPREEFTNPNPQ